MYREIPAPPELKDVVRYFWSIEGADVGTQRYRLLAESSPGLVFFYRSGHGLLAGITDHYCEFGISGELGMVGAYLFPYCLPAMFNISACDATNTQVPLADALGREGIELQTQVAEAANSEARFHVLAGFLERRKHAARGLASGLFQGIRHLVQHNGNLKLEHLARNLGISHRQLDRRFQGAVGIAPKVFSCLVRFQASLQLPKKQVLHNLTDLALAAGYYDQSHFIRDFREYAGMSPRQYFALRANAADNFVRL